VSAKTDGAPAGFAVSHAADADWDAGLRTFFSYRDLGVAAATGGKVGAHVIRARDASAVRGDPHRHTLEFQLVYVLRGWITFDYAGVGPHSADLEMLEITLPAEFPTTD
jgi:hypothetical protein